MHKSVVSQTSREVILRAQRSPPPEAKKKITAAKRDRVSTDNKKGHNDLNMPRRKVINGFSYTRSASSIFG